MYKYFPKKILFFCLVLVLKTTSSFAFITLINKSKETLTFTTIPKTTVSPVITILPEGKVAIPPCDCFFLQAKTKSNVYLFEFSYDELSSRQYFIFLGITDTTPYKEKTEKLNFHDFSQQLTKSEEETFLNALESYVNEEDENIKVKTYWVCKLIDTKPPYNKINRDLGKKE